jgi:regulator of protease activity HflC (stomatin/prohibitin superfamily)
MIWFALLLAAIATGLLVFRKTLPPGLRHHTASVTIAMAGIALLFGLLSAVTVVPAGHVGVPVVFGKVQDRNLGEGLHLINPFAHVVSMTVRTETYTMSSVRDEGAVKGDDSITALSADGLMMPLDVTLAYRLIGTGGRD